MATGQRARAANAFASYGIARYPPVLLYIAIKNKAPFGAKVSSVMVVLIASAWEKANVLFLPMRKAFFKQRGELLLFCGAEEGKKRSGVRVRAGAVMQVMPAAAQRAQNPSLRRGVLMKRPAGEAVLLMHPAVSVQSAAPMPARSLMSAVGLARRIAPAVKICLSPFAAWHLRGAMPAAAGASAFLISFAHVNPSFPDPVSGSLPEFSAFHTQKNERYSSTGLT